MKQQGAASCPKDFALHKNRCQENWFKSKLSQIDKRRKARAKAIFQVGEPLPR
jgi:hypothetical protein